MKNIFSFITYIKVDKKNIKRYKLKMDLLLNFGFILKNIIKMKIQI